MRFAYALKQTVPRSGTLRSRRANTFAERGISVSSLPFLTLRNLLLIFGKGGGSINYLRIMYLGDGDFNGRLTGGIRAILGGLSAGSGRGFLSQPANREIDCHPSAIILRKDGAPS